MPAQGQYHCQHCHQRRKGGKESPNFNRLTGGYQIGRQILEHILEFSCAGSGIISPAGNICDGGERLFINFPAEASASTKRVAKPTSATSKLIVLLKLETTIHRRSIVDCAKPNGVHPHTPLRGL